MRDVVRDAFVPFTIPLEGAIGGGYIGIPWMYPDVKNLVSTGLGNLIDPVSLAIGLPWVHLDGTPATREDIVAEWIRVKNLPPDVRGRTAAQLGHLYAKPHTRLRLTPLGIEQLVRSKLHMNEQIIRGTFHEWEEWPADAQLATHSMAWACGPGIFSPKAGRAHWPKLTAALHARDFRTAAEECFMPEEKHIGGLRPRNIANRILYTNAAIAQNHLDPEVLFYPTDLEKGPVDREAETQPDLPVVDEPDPDSTRIVDFAIIHPKVPLRGDPPDEPPDAA
jgi:hypothetical protein